MSMSIQPTNRLSGESSPYLLQHAHNPVDWYPWSDEALQKAKKENKPILLSIGYATCHWCHVMEKESFEDVEVAEYMNRHFINIKVDREERPDLDLTYMEAAQLMTGQGGWPLNCFLTPELHPFFAGTYFPPEPRYNRPSWMQVLNSIAKAWAEQPHSLIEHGLRVSRKISETDAELIKQARVEFPNIAQEEVSERLLNILDFEKGGMRGAPKFPAFPLIDYCLHAGYIYQNEKLLQHALFSLGEMVKGGIYDPIDGGICRYSVDDSWEIPHFEKMLYDNSALLHSLAIAYRMDKNLEWKIIGEDICRFLEDCLSGNQGGFYAGLDADSEGVEGKYYSWQKSEIFQAAGEQKGFLELVFHWPEKGIFEGEHLLIRKDTWESLALEHQTSVDEFLKQWFLVRRKIRSRRLLRIPPARDEKYVTAWNALAVKGLASFGAAVGNSELIQRAKNTLAFIETGLRRNGKLMRTKTNNVFGPAAFLEDYAYLLDAYLEMAAISASDAYYVKAERVLEEIFENFERDDQGMFCFVQQSKLEPIPQKNALFDMPLPSANSVIGMSMLKLGIRNNRTEWIEIANEMAAAVSPAIKKYSGSLPSWGKLNLYISNGLPEYRVTGEAMDEMVKLINKSFIGEAVVQTDTDSGYGIPKAKNVPGKIEAQLIMCKNYVCRNSVSLNDDVTAAIKQHLLE